VRRCSKDSGLSSVLPFFFRIHLFEPFWTLEPFDLLSESCEPLQGPQPEAFSDEWPMAFLVVASKRGVRESTEVFWGPVGCALHLYGTPILVCLLCLGLPSNLPLLRRARSLHL